jgi:class 3 adenylate cyclase
MNVASRLEGHTKELGYPMLVAAEVQSGLGNGSGLVDLGEHRIKGYRPVRLYEVRKSTHPAPTSTNAAQ